MTQPEQRPDLTALQRAIDQYLANQDPHHKLQEHPNQVTILAFKGHLLLLQADKTTPTLIRIHYLDLDDPVWITQFKHNEWGWKPTRYQYVCDQCHMATSAEHPEPSISCKFCGHKTKNNNFAAWKRFKKLMEKN